MGRTQSPSEPDSNFFGGFLPEPNETVYPEGKENLLRSLEGLLKQARDKGLSLEHINLWISILVEGLLGKKKQTKDHVVRWLACVAPQFLKELKRGVPVSEQIES